MNLRNLSLTLGAAILVAASAHAVPVKDCPAGLRVDFGAPELIKQYAQRGFASYFAERGRVVSELRLVSTRNSECRYEGAREPAGFFEATLKGSLRANAIEPAVLVAYANLPIRSPRPKQMPLDAQVVYLRVTALQPDRIETGATAGIYRIGEICSYGDCIPDHVYLGAFKSVAVEALP